MRAHAPSVGGAHMCHRQQPEAIRTCHGIDLGYACVWARVRVEFVQPILFHFSLFPPLRCQQVEGQNQQYSAAQRGHNPRTCNFTMFSRHFSAEHMRYPFFILARVAPEKFVHYTAACKE